MKLTLATPLAIRERELNPSSCTGGQYQSFLDEYQSASDAAVQTLNAQVALQRNLAYGDKASQRLDYFPASNPRLAAEQRVGSALPPLLVFIHGGYWQELSKDSALFAAQDCVPEGIAFAALDYTLAPQASLLEMVLECRSALRWLHAHAAELGFDAQRLVLAGSSAGAHLAAMCGLRHWSADGPLPIGLPQAVVLVSGVFDLVPLIGTSIDRALRLDPASAALLSPLRQDLSAFPRAVVCWGEHETNAFKQQSRAMAERIDASQATPHSSTSRAPASPPTGTSASPLAATALVPAVPTPAFEVPARNHFNVILELAKRQSTLGDTTLSLFVSHSLQEPMLCPNTNPNIPI